MTIAHRVTECRKKTGLTQTQLAELANCSSGMISSIERGARNMSYEMACSISNVLDVSPDYLLNRIPEKTDELTLKRKIQNECKLFEAFLTCLNSIQEYDIIFRFNTTLPIEFPTYASDEKHSECITEWINAINILKADYESKRYYCLIPYLEKVIKGLERGSLNKNSNKTLKRNGEISSIEFSRYVNPEQHSCCMDMELIMRNKNALHSKLFRIHDLMKLFNQFKRSAEFFSATALWGSCFSITPPNNHYPSRRF